MSKQLFSIISISVSSLTAFLFAVTPSFAGNINYSRNMQCPNPNGNQTANYSDGWHWIPGYSQMMWGKDTVTDVGNQNYVQCFCPTSSQMYSKRNDGIQTSWIYANNINSFQQQMLQQSGWQMRNDGTSFGLPQNNYFVKNYSFSCSNNAYQKNLNKNITYKTSFQSYRNW